MAQEKQFENKIKDFLKDNNCWFVKFFANAYTKSGIPDILACVNGRFVGIEVKAKNGKPSDLQIYNLQKIEDSGGFAVLLYPDDFEDFKRMIHHILEDDIDEAWYFERRLHLKHGLNL